MVLRRYRLRIFGKKLIRWTLYTTGFLLFILFLAPVRNTIGYFFLPGAWRQLSSIKIIKLYFADPLYPVEETKVTCGGVQGKINTVHWEDIVAEVDNLPSYDEDYFLRLSSNPAVYGTSKDDMQRLENRYYKFKPTMTSIWQKQMLMTFKVFVRAMELFDMMYFLSEGSMLGSYRHHGFIPWDDDMDIVMNGTDWLRVKTILHCIPGFDVNTENNMMYKFFWNKAPLWKTEDFIRFPFIDIFFFNEDSEYIWAITQFKKNRIVYKKSDIFPLSFRPYEGIIVPVPGKIEKICTTVYDPHICVSRDFDHLNRHFLPFYEVEYIPCNTFSRLYPFVARQKKTINGQRATVEYRMIGKKIISNYTVFH